MQQLWYSHRTKRQGHGTKADALQKKGEKDKPSEIIFDGLSYYIKLFSV